jgi:hypothetical protein
LIIYSCWLIAISTTVALPYGGNELPGSPPKYRPSPRESSDRILDQMERGEFDYENDHNERYYDDYDGLESGKAVDSAKTAAEGRKLSSPPSFKDWFSALQEFIAPEA